MAQANMSAFIWSKLLTFGAKRSTKRSGILAAKVVAFDTLGSFTGRRIHQDAGAVDN